LDKTNKEDQVGIGWMTSRIDAILIRPHTEDEKMKKKIIFDGAGPNTLEVDCQANIGHQRV